MKRKNAVHWIWDVTGKKRRKIFLLTALQGLAGSTDVVYALLFRSIVDSAAARDKDTFLSHVFLIIGLVILQLGMSAFIRRLYEAARSDIENTFKQRLLDHLLRKDYASVSATHTAEWLNRLTGDAAVAADGIADLLPGLTETIVRMAAALIMIIILDSWFACILIPGGILMIAVSHVFRNNLKRMHKDIQESDGRLRIFLQERISGLMIIKAFMAEDQTGRSAAAAMAEHRAAKLRRNRFSNVVNFGFGAAMEGTYLICTVYCAHGIMTGRVSFGTMTAVMQLVGQVQGPLTGLSGYLPRWYAMTASAERLMEAEAYKDDSPGDDTQTHAYEEKRIQAFYRDRFQALKLQNISFTYPYRETDMKNDQKGFMSAALQNLSLEIRKGEYLAFTGQSGCGKSTVLKLLICIYSPDSGERTLVSADGTLPLTPQWRGLFAYVPQGNQLMCGRLRDVVAFSCPDEAENEEKLMRVLSIACVDEFLPEMEDGLDTMLGERGAGISEGQMQRIAIARALFSDRPILLLDEATSALDEKTERRLMENLRSLQDKTVIMVTHRKTVLSACDRVIVFDGAGSGEL